MNEKTYVLSYNQGPWNIQIAAIRAKSSELIAWAFGGKIYFALEGHARIRLSKDAFARMPLPPEIIQHVLAADASAPEEFQTEIRLRLTALPVLSLPSSQSA